MSTRLIIFLLTVSSLIGLTTCLDEGITFVQEGELPWSSVKLHCVFKKFHYFVRTIDILNESNISIASIERKVNTAIQYVKDNHTVNGTAYHDKGSLTVIWDTPTKSILGRYVCYVSTYLYENLTYFKSELKLHFRDPSISELFNYTQNYISQTEDSLRKNSEEISRLKGELIKLQNQTQVEEGSIDCGSSKNYTEVYDGPSHNCSTHKFEVHRSVLFKKPFPKTPTITIYVEKLDARRKANIRYYIRKSSEQPEGFKLTCGTWCASRINELTVHWQARIN